MKSSFGFALVGISIIVLSAGCDLFLDLTTIAFQSPSPTEKDADVDLDVGPDVDVDFDADDDTTDVEPDTAEEPDTGPELFEEPDTVADADSVEPPRYCPFEFGDFNADCDPVTETGCSQGRHCSLGFSGGSIVVACMGLTTAGSLNEGDPCAFPIEDNCQRGLYCLNWAGADRRHVCSKFCFLSTNEGCSEDQFCTYHFDRLDDTGFCVDRCDPYDPNACAEGSVCSPDPNYLRTSPWTCHPEFRCLRNGAPPEPVDYQSTCNIATLPQNGCPQGQTCSLTDSGQKCVIPCQADEDCVSLGMNFICGEPQSAFDLRYCLPPD